MKVFISWSGSPSKEIAGVLAKYIPDIIQEAEPFYSPDSISKGKQWSNAINGELNSSSFGILCITKNNFRSDWIAYEAGALTKPVAESKICPLLFDMQPSDITHSPLTMFQMTMINKTDMLKFFHSMNTSCEKILPDERLNRIFNKTWSDLEKEFEDIRQIFKNNEGNNEPTATSQDMIKEILELVRQMNKDSLDKSLNDYMIENQIQASHLTKEENKQLKNQKNLLRMTEEENKQLTNESILSRTDEEEMKKFANLTNPTNLTHNRILSGLTQEDIIKELHYFEK